MKSQTKKLATVFTVLLGLLAIISPIIWDIYTRGSAIELRYVSSITLIDKPYIEKLEILYDGKPIRNLTKHEFILVNSGQKPIVQADIIEPLKISFSGIKEILSVDITSLSPKELLLDYKITKDKEAVLITFPLLNSEDTAHFSVLSIGGASSNFKARARIINISNIDIIDETSSAKERRISWLAVYYLFVSVMLFVFSFINFKAIRKEMEVGKEFKSEGFSIPEPEGKDGYAELIEKYFSTRSSSEMADINTLLLQMEPGSSITEGRHNQIVEIFHRIAGETSRNWLWLILTLLGGVFFLWAAWGINKIS